MEHPLNRYKLMRIDIDAMEKGQERRSEKCFGGGGREWMQSEKAGKS
jgi:hypothetical protein